LLKLSVVRIGRELQRKVFDLSDAGVSSINSVFSFDSVVFLDGGT
jgi:hypothetical protein